MLPPVRLFLLFAGGRRTRGVNTCDEKAAATATCCFTWPSIYAGPGSDFFVVVGSRGWEGCRVIDSKRLAAAATEAITAQKKKRAGGFAVCVRSSLSTVTTNFVSLFFFFLYPLFVREDVGCLMTRKRRCWRLFVLFPFFLWMHRRLLDTQYPMGATAVRLRRRSRGRRSSSLRGLFCCFQHHRRWASRRRNRARRAHGLSGHIWLLVGLLLSSVGFLCSQAIFPFLFRKFSSTLPVRGGRSLQVCLRNRQGYGYYCLPI